MNYVMKCVENDVEHGMIVKTKNGYF
jgi:hypothetical protein